MDIENAVTSFCKRTPTAKIAWTEIVAKFLKMYPDISREDFELCMLRQGKRAAVEMQRSFIKYKRKGYNYFRDLYGITAGFFDACLAIESSYGVSKNITNGDTNSPKRSYHRNPTTKIYITIFRISPDEYSKEAVDLLKRFIDNLNCPLQVIECTNPRMIEVRELKK
jgi:lysozyme family protein